MMGDDTAGALPGIIESLPDGVVAGLGLRNDASLREILALVETCLLSRGHVCAHLVALTTSIRKTNHPALLAAAERLRVPLLGVDDTLIAAVSARVPNPSTRVAFHIGLPSVAEASALAFGPLIAPKHRSANVTCALSAFCAAQLRDLPVSTSSASSTLETSGAGR